MIQAKWLVSEDTGLLIECYKRRRVDESVVANATQAFLELRKTSHEMSQVNEALKKARKDKNDSNLASTLKERASTLRSQVRQCEEELESFLLVLPNLIHAQCPRGVDVCLDEKSFANNSNVDLKAELKQCFQEKGFVKSVERLERKTFLRTELPMRCAMMKEDHMDDEFSFVSIVSPSDGWQEHDVHLEVVKRFLSRLSSVSYRLEESSCENMRRECARQWNVKIAGRLFCSVCQLTDFESRRDPQMKYGAIGSALKKSIFDNGLCWITKTIVRK